ncbi:MAG: hypothetical protein K1000chlam3_00781 [Chlamydiae bacterium]|nr:hypothetical protein [Chlamydiota bacterium]
MISHVSLNMVPRHFSEHGGNKCSSFFGRIFSLNWDKAHLLANLVLVVSGVAYAFFMKLPPMIMFSIGFYGILVVALYAKAQKSRPSQGQINDLNEKLQVAREKNTIFERKIKDEMSAGDMKETLLEDIKTGAHKLAAQEVAKKRYGREIVILKNERQSLSNSVSKLNRTIDAFGNEGRNAKPGSPEQKIFQELKRRMQKA